MQEFLKAWFVVLHFCSYTSITFYIAAYVNDTTLYSKEDQAYNL